MTKTNEEMSTAIMILKLTALAILCVVVVKMFIHLIIQLTYYCRSRHIERFLSNRSLTAEEYLERHRKVWHHGFKNAPHLRGAGAKAFIWKLLCRARKDIAIRIFENTEGLAFYCFSCYFNPKCETKYYLTCQNCKDERCDKKQSGRLRICKRFACKIRIVND